MYKSQLAALGRILDAEKNDRIGKSCGVHPSGDRYIVTEGHVAIVLRDKPDGYQEADRLDDLVKIVDQECKYGDHILAFSVTAEQIKEWKRLSKPWNGGKTQNTGAVPVEITARTEDGSQISGFYNPVLLVDAAEAVGTGCMLYIGHDTRRNSQLSTLLVFPKDWMGTDPGIMGFVISLRM